MILEFDCISVTAGSNAIVSPYLNFNPAYVSPVSTIFSENISPYINKNKDIGVQHSFYVLWPLKRLKKISVRLK